MVETNNKPPPLPKPPPVPYTGEAAKARKKKKISAEKAKEKGKETIKTGAKKAGSGIVKGSLSAFGLDAVTMGFETIAKIPEHVTSMAKGTASAIKDFQESIMEEEEDDETQETLQSVEENTSIVPKILTDMNQNVKSMVGLQEDTKNQMAFQDEKEAEMRREEMLSERKDDEKPGVIVKEGEEEGGGFLSSLLSGFGLKMMFDNLKAFIPALFGLIGPMMKLSVVLFGVYSIFEGILAGFREYKDGGGFFDILKEGLKGFLNALTLGFFSEFDMEERLANLFAPVFTVLIETSNFFKNFFNTVQSVFEGAIEFVMSIPDNIKSLADNALSFIGGLFSSIKEKFNSIFSFIGSIGEQIVSVINMSIQGYKALFTKGFQSVKTGLMSVFNAFSAGISNIMSIFTPDGFYNKLVAPIMSFVSSISSKIVSAFENISISGMVGGIIDPIKDFFSDIMNTINSIFSVDNIMSFIPEGIRDIASGLFGGDEEENLPRKAGNDDIPVSNITKNFENRETINREQMAERNFFESANTQNVVVQNSTPVVNNVQNNPQKVEHIYPNSSRNTETTIQRMNDFSFAGSF